MKGFLTISKQFLNVCKPVVRDYVYKLNFNIYAVRYQK